VAAADPEAEIRELVARVTRAVADRAGADVAKNRADLAAIVASEVAAAVAAGEKARVGGGRRAVVTTTGRNAKGVVAKIAQAIADASSTPRTSSSRSRTSRPGSCGRWPRWAPSAWSCTRTL